MELLKTLIDVQNKMKVVKKWEHYTLLKGRRPVDKLIPWQLFQERGHRRAFVNGNTLILEKNAIEWFEGRLP